MSLTSDNQIATVAASVGNRLSDYATVDLIEELEQRDPEWLKRHPEFCAAIQDRERFKAGFEDYQRRIKAALNALGIRTMDELDDEDFVAGLKPMQITVTERGVTCSPTSALRRSERPDCDKAGVTVGETAIKWNASAQKMMDMLDRIAPARVTWASLAAMVGNKPRGGNFNAARRALRESDSIVEDGDTVRSAAPQFGEPLSRESARQLWREVLSNPAPRMIDALQVRPMSKIDLGAFLGIVPRGGNFNNGVAQMVRNGVAIERGGVLHLAEPLPGEGI